MESISRYNIKGLLFDMPLYEKLSINITDIVKENSTEIRYENFIGDKDLSYEVPVYEEKYPKEFSDFIDFLVYEDNLYGYCHKCKRENSLKVVKINIDERLLQKGLNGTYGDDVDDYDEDLAKIKLNERIEILLKKHEYFTKSVNCLHDSNHKQKFIYKLEIQKETNKEAKLILQKIGQDPSNVEFFNYNIRNKYSAYKNYKNIESDLNKAVISYENNFSVGGFIYLRRVLEKIVDYKYDEVKEHLKNDEKVKYENKKTKFKEKIDILKNELPQHLIENKCIYNILSAGVHSLTEEECLKYFPVVKNSVYLILDELLEIQKRNKLNDEIKKQLNSIHSETKKK